MTAYAMDMSIAFRADRFSALLKHVEITARDGAAFGLESGMAVIMKILLQARENRGNVYIIGNGGSAGIASHAVIDLLHIAKLQAFTLHGSSLLTCMANDYGYDNAFARILSQITRPGDVLIAISSSGNSKNIRNAAAQVTEAGGKVITLSGFACDNPLRSSGDINVWLDASDFGMVEIGHQFILHNISDRFGAGYEELETP